MVAVSIMRTNIEQSGEIQLAKIVTNLKESNEGVDWRERNWRPNLQQLKRASSVGGYLDELIMYAEWATTSAITLNGNVQSVVRRYKSPLQIT